jgi:hypothetical protein
MSPDSPTSRIFRISSTLRHDPAIDTWLDAQTDELGAWARAWFAQMRQCGPDVRELMHDGCPVACVDDAPFAYVNVFTSHMNVGFFHGAHLDDPAELLVGSGKRMRHVKLVPGIEPDTAALRHLIEDAYADIKRWLTGAGSTF